MKADPKAPLSWEPGNNRRAVVSRPAGMASSSGDEIDLVLGLLSVSGRGSVYSCVW